jgi:hypothetical protein
LNVLNGKKVVQTELGLAIVLTIIDDLRVPRADCLLMKTNCIVETICSNCVHRFRFNPSKTKLPLLCPECQQPALEE